MAFSPFLSAALHSSADLAGVDFDWLPDSSTKLPWNSELSDSCGDGSPTSPPQPQTIRRPTNSFLLHQTFGLLNPSLKTNDFLQHPGSSSPPPPPPSATDNLLNRPSFLASDFQKNNQRAESPVSCESSITIEGMSRACRYSPEEKKERIERYRRKKKPEELQQED